MARTRSENYDGIHLGILTNAARLFSAQGYMRASIADLADACKLSRGALYHYFDSKEAILFAILDAHIREMIEHVETAVAAGGPTLTQFQNVIRADRRGQCQIAARAARADSRSLVPERG